jgi:hypothetical protein
MAFGYFPPKRKVTRARSARKLLILIRLGTRARHAHVSGLIVQFIV